jgi:hypothetical protein
MAITIQEVRQKYPQYADLSDKQLVDALHSKYYADIPKNDFYNQVGLTAKEDVALEQLETGLQEEVRQQRRQKASDVLRSVATGAVRGVSGVAGLPALLEQVGPTKGFIQQMPGGPLAELAKATQRTGLISGKPGVAFPSQQRIISGVEQIPGATAVTQYQPQTKAGEFAETISEFAAPGGLFARGIKPAATAMGVGGVGGVVQETQEQAGMSPWQSLPLTLLSTLGAG